MELKIESELEVTIGSFDSAESALLRSGIDARRPPISGPRRLAWPRTSPFHGGNTGSNPVGDANKIKYLQEPQFPTRYALRYGLVCE